MGRRRKLPDNIIQLDFFNHMLDCVVLDTKPFYVQQEDGKWPPYAEVISSRVWNRDPRVRDEQSRLARALAEARHPMTFTPPKYSKWCSFCGEWVDRLSFSEDKSRHDGLHDWCKTCRNRHARRMYYLMKEAQQAA